jgi:NADH-quinone oxidoreductase subunit M
MIFPLPLLQTVVVPLLSVPIIIIVAKTSGKHAGWIASIVLAYTSMLLLLTWIDLWNGVGPVSETYAWSSSVFNLEFGFLADGLSLPVALVMNLACTAGAIYSYRYIEHRIHDLYQENANSMYAIYYSLFVLFPVGLLGVALSTNLIAMYLFVEMALIPAYFLMDLFGYRDRHRIAIMYFIWNQVGAGLFLIGVVLATAGTGGSFSITALSAIAGTELGFWVTLLILLGWLIKMATFGFHVWLPYVHGEHLANIAAIIATILGLGSYVLVRVLAGQLLTNFQVFSLPLMVLALITLVYGGLLTLAQDDVKRLFACSTISQTAYSLFGVASLSAMGMAGGIFYFLSHTLGKTILLCVAGIIMMQTGVRDMNKMGGLAKKMPWTAALSVMGAMILSAIPPMSGFQAEWVLFTGSFQAASLEGMMRFVIPIAGVLATFLTAAYTFWPVKRIFFGPLSEDLEDVEEAPISMTVPLLALALISLLFGIYPDILMRLLSAFF